MYLSNIFSWVVRAFSATDIFSVPLLSTKHTFAVSLLPCGHITGLILLQSFLQFVFLFLCI